MIGKLELNVLYFGKIVDGETVDKYTEPYQVAQYSYEKALYDEFIKKEKDKFSINSIVQTLSFPKAPLIINENKTDKNFNYLAFINLPVLKEISYFLWSFFIVLKNKGKTDIILSSVHYTPVSLGTSIASKLIRVPNIITFTDLSSFSYSEQRIKNMSFLKRLVVRPYKKLTEYLERNYDGYILFSKEMNSKVNKKKKPFLVIEGIYNSEKLDMTIFKKNKNKKVICHAGTLNREVGIDKTLEVFNQLEFDEYELWLIGNGDMVEEIKENSKANPSIKYFGFLPREEVFNYLKKADLLVNFRNPNDVFTKYSFPSKMFEYMASATPVLTTKLEGIPSEYYNYVYSSKFNTPDLVKSIKKILNKPSEELLEFGKNAQKFVIENKNSRTQSKKILKFLESFIAKKEMS